MPFHWMQFAFYESKEITSIERVCRLIKKEKHPLFPTNVF